MSETRSGPGSSRDVPLGELLRRIADHSAALGEARLHMARTELAEDLAVLARRLGVALAAVLLVVFGLQFLVVAAVLALATQLGGWLASLVVSILFLVAGAAVLALARSRAAAPLLRKTRESLEEDFRWLRALVR